LCPIHDLSAAGALACGLQVPPTRSDILHACDVVEDVAIAHGYNNIPKRVSACILLSGLRFRGARQCVLVPDTKRRVEPYGEQRDATCFLDASRLLGAGI